MSFVEEIRKEFEPKLLLPSLTVGLLAGVMTLGMEISLAAYVFSGALSQSLAGGIGVMLFGALVFGIVVGLVTSVPGAIAVPQDTPIAILALLAAGIAAYMGSAPPEAVFATVVTIAILVRSKWAL